MHILRILLPGLLLTVTAHAQLDKEKPAKPKPPAEALIGVWRSTALAVEECMTFTPDGRVIMLRGPSESMTLNYKVDVSAVPWKLDMSGKLTDTSGKLKDMDGKPKEMQVAVYTVFDFPEPDVIRMAQPNIHKEQRPEAAALKDARLTMKRVTLGTHGGIYQVVEAVLKRLAGTWEGKEGSETVTLTFAADGTFTMKLADFTDKGRFRIDVSKLPVSIDLLSSEGTGIKYSIMEFAADGQLRVGKAAKKSEERPAAFDDISTKTFKRKDVPPAKPE